MYYNIISKDIASEFNLTPNQTIKSYGKRVKMKWNNFTIIESETGKIKTISEVINEQYKDINK